MFTGYHGHAPTLYNRSPEYEAPLLNFSMPALAHYATRKTAEHFNVRTNMPYDVNDGPSSLVVHRPYTYLAPAAVQRASIYQPLYGDAHPSITYLPSLSLDNNAF